MRDEADVCVIGSGAGGGSVAATLAEAGYSVVVLEKGPWFPREQLKKDEIAFARRRTLKPLPDTEPQVEEWLGAQGRPQTIRTEYFRNPQIVGGASVVMSAFFLRLKPIDFRLRSTMGPVPGANIADWPITYDDLEPWYARAERELGVSGIVTDLPKDIADRRSTDFPLEPTDEHPLAWHVDDVLERAGLHPFPLPRGILSESRAGRGSCNYSGYCGSYGCTTGAKASSLNAMIPRALATKRCVVRPHAMVTRLESDSTGKVVRAHWIDDAGNANQVEASTFVVACQAIESARLLLNSRGPRHPQGLGNARGQVGRNLIFSTFGSAYGDFTYAQHKDIDLASDQPFVNRAVQDYYVMRDGKGKPTKGGTLTYIRVHPNPIGASLIQALRDPKKPLWGRGLKQRLSDYFHAGRHMEVETFAEWFANPRCFVKLDPQVRDRFGLPVARIGAYTHPQNRATAHRLVDHAQDHLRRLGATEVFGASGVGGPSTNLVGGTCRFGDDPASSVLDRDCRAHDVPNLYVTDGSFMPTGGAVPFTFTIYANALRVADRIVAALGGRR